MDLFRISGDEVSVIPERTYRDEAVDGFGESTLEHFILEHPEIIPGEEINGEDPPRFMTIKNQAGVTPGSMDILLIDHKAIPTVVEAKLVDNREIRRSVLAQGVEYLAHLRDEWTSDRILEEGRAFWAHRGQEFEVEARRRLGVDLDGDFLDQVVTNLQANKVRLIIASDAIPAELRRVIEFLNEASVFDVYGLEVRFFANEGEEDRILAPRLVGLTMKSRAVAGRGTRWNEDGFFTALEAASPPDEVALARDLLNFATEISDGRVDWGTGKLRGSFTARVVINGERYSVFSVYTTGQATLNAGWNKTKLDQIGSELAEQYRAKTKERLSLSFNERDWTTGWPMIPLSTLVRDNAAVFRELASGFVSDLTAFVSQQQELHL